MLDRKSTTFKKTFAKNSDALDTRLNITNTIMRIYAATMEPNILRQMQFADTMRLVADDWVEGTVTLLEGYLPPSLITEHMIERVLSNIKHKILSQSQYGGFRLLHHAPGFYYKLKKAINYGVSDDGSIHITLKIPLHKGEGVPLYRIHSFPIPVRAGINAPSDSTDGGYTKIANLPDFIAVTRNLESYVELTMTQYLAMGGDTSDLGGVLSGALGLPQLQSSSVYDTCAYSLFTKNAHTILRSCDTRYTKVPPLGSAVQLLNDQSVLVHGGADKTGYWTLVCPQHQKGGVQRIEVCEMCRVNIPCGCTLRGRDFIYPPQISGCVHSDPQSTPTVTRAHHANFFTLGTIVDSDTINKIPDSSLDYLYPPLDSPVPVFDVVEDTLQQHLQKSEEYSAQFQKLVDLTKKNVTKYSDRSESALRKALNFSGEVKSRAGSLTKALSNVFGIFGDLWGPVGFILSSYGISLIAFVLNFTLFLPVFLKCCHSHHGRDAIVMHPFKIDHAITTDKTPLLKAGEEMEEEL